MNGPNDLHHVTQVTFDFANLKTQKKKREKRKKAVDSFTQPTTYSNPSTTTYHLLPSPNDPNLHFQSIVDPFTQPTTLTDFGHCVKVSLK